MRIRLCSRAPLFDGLPDGPREPEEDCRESIRIEAAREQGGGQKLTMGEGGPNSKVASEILTMACSRLRERREKGERERGDQLCAEASQVDEKMNTHVKRIRSRVPREALFS